MLKHLFRLAWALGLMVTFAGCRATDSARGSKAKVTSQVPDVTSGSPSQSPFVPYPAN